MDVADMVRDDLHGVDGRAGGRPFVEKTQEEPIQTIICESRSPGRKILLNRQRETNTVRFCSSLKWGVATIDPFPASNSVAGWDKTSDTRVFAAKDLWQYVDGDSEQYIQAGVVSTSTADYKYQGQLEAVVDVYTMGDSAGARKILESEQSKDAKSVTLGDAGIAYQQSVTFRKGPYLVRIVSYESTPDGPQALLALAHGVESKL
jgi:hypothetical protein